ncbi:cation:proton antiporter [Patulibacter sp. SYSU D01012]|uniref:cation:proton antiporter domain-containing protein n=1 Tax=Patulibacter sp. SYSU D01012 TaxID=2817381 RepID=UPI001B31760C
MRPPVLLADAEPGISLLGAVPEILFLAALAGVLAIGALSNESERAFSTGIVYLAMGAIAAVLLPAIGVQHLDLRRDHEIVEILSEVTIAVAVFATGLRVRRASLRRWRTVGLLLLVTLPLTAGAIALFASTAMGLSAGAALVLGAALAPTDPVLAGDVGLGPPGESEDEPRAQAALTAEAGGNDGAAMPILVLGLVLARDDGATGGLGAWLTADVLYALAVPVVVGVVGGIAAAGAMRWGVERGLVARDFPAWAAVATALLLYSSAELLGGYGFVAAFAGGLALRRRRYEDEARRQLHDGAGGAERVLVLAVLLLVGSSLTLDGLGRPGLEGWLLAPLLIVVLRPAFALLALVGSGMPRGERLYVAWFGVRGVAAVNYTTAALATGLLATGEAETVMWTAIAVMIVSVVVHGTTSSALERRWLRAGRRAAHGPEAA